MDVKGKPDRIIEELGGCGRFQIHISIIVHMIKTIVGFSASIPVVAAKTPPWRCMDDAILGNYTSCVVQINGTDVNICPENTCMLSNGTKCSRFVFDGRLKTLVTEFGLVCGQDYIPSLVMTLQIGGLLGGNLCAGQLADLVGRRPVFFTSIVIIVLSNLVGFMSVNWIMFAATRILVGFGCRFFLSTQYSLLSEFSLAKWRVWIVGFPSWPIQACLFVLCAWLIQDWRYLQLLTAVMGVPCMLAWLWHVGHDKREKAIEVINKVAKYNKRPEVNVGQLLEAPEVTKDTKYTILDLFKSKDLIKSFVLFSFNWLGLGLTSYGINYGIQALSGNFFINYFLLNILGIPSKGIAIWLQNRFGRRMTAILCYGLVSISGIIVGVVQTVDVPNRVGLTNAFAMLASVGIGTAWGPVQTMTIELYPTVVRTSAFGTLSVIGRVGAMIGPQLVYLDVFVPGLLYYVCGAIGAICVFGTYQLPETMGADLSDKISQVDEQSEKQSNTKNGVV